MSRPSLKWRCRKLKRHVENLVSINIYWKLSYVYLVDRESSATVCCVCVCVWRQTRAAMLCVRRNVEEQSRRRRLIFFHYFVFIRCKTEERGTKIVCGVVKRVCWKIFGWFNCDMHCTHTAEALKFLMPCVLQTHSYVKKKKKYSIPRHTIISTPGTI